MLTFQEELYELILETNKECVKLCRPGTSIREIHNYSVKSLHLFRSIVILPYRCSPTLEFVMSELCDILCSTVA